jgi:hypothetical protein
MTQRLVESYAVGALVEIAFEDRCGNATWVPGVVVRHDFPAVWVRTPDGREWFVTSGKRIRARTP